MTFVYYIEPVAFLRCYHAFFDWVSYPFERNVTSCAMPNFFSSFISPPLTPLARWRLIFAPWRAISSCVVVSAALGALTRMWRGRSYVSSSMSHPHSHCMCVWGDCRGNVDIWFKAEDAIPPAFPAEIAIYNESVIEWLFRVICCHLAQCVCALSVCVQHVIRLMPHCVFS